MGFRFYEYCKDCKRNRTDRWGFGVRKEGGCLFPNTTPEYGLTTSDRCQEFEAKEEE